MFNLPLSMISHERVCESNSIVGKPRCRILVTSEIEVFTMFLTSEHELGEKNSDDLAFIVKFCWRSPLHMKEAIKILLSARLDGGKRKLRTRFDSECSEIIEEVHFHLAGNPETSEEVLSYLGKVGNPRICERVALNPRTPEEALRQMAEHEDPEVRAAVGENPYCPITILYRLAKDEHPDVRFRLAENPNLPNSILEELGADSNPFISSRANATLRRLAGGAVVEGKFRFNNQSGQLLAN